ncbi:MAG: AMP-binding protein [Kiritimatiellae bacterium]|nr:AMP-binding protein [Kiritimatiellia bacterium]
MANTLRYLLDNAAAESGGRIAIEYLDGGHVKSITYTQLQTSVKRTAELLSVAGIATRSRPVALMLDNSHEWVEAYLALACTATPVVPMDPKLRAAEVSYILSDSETCAIVTDAAHIPLLEAVLPGLPLVQTVFLYHCDGAEAPAQICSRRCVAVERSLDIDGKRALTDSGRYAATHVAEDDTCAIIYTSGTTGSPKGAILTHANFVIDAAGAAESLALFNRNDRFLVVLPLFHAFSFTANFIIALTYQARLQFVRSLRTIGEDMKIFHPTILMAVPLLVEKFAQKIDDALRNNRVLLLFQAFHLRGLIKHLILRSLGGRIRVVITGGAPCPTDVISTMRRFGIPVVEGYGLTEAAPVVSVSNWRRPKIGTIGPAIPGIDIRIDSPDAQGIGELIIRGPIVMKGYLNRPADTEEALRDGWLHTGDLATVDSDGYITIRGRKKALIVNREGKNIYPEEVEKCLERDRRLKDILVLGYHDGQDVGEKVGAIIVPDTEQFKGPDGAVRPEAEIEAEVRAAVHTLCGDLATYKHPRKIEVRFEPLRRTAALKIARGHYQGQLDRP